MKTLKFLSVVLLCCLVCNTMQAQTVIKSNKNKKVIVKKNNNKKVIVKTNKYNSHGSHHYGNGKVIVKTNRNNIIVKRPNRPKYVKKAFFKRQKVQYEL